MGKYQNSNLVLIRQKRLIFAKVNNMKKIAVFHWGQISIHTYYLVEQLSKEDLSVVLYLYTPTYANKQPFLSILVDKLKEMVNVIEIKCTKTEARLISATRIGMLLRRPWGTLCINPFLPGKTRQRFNARDFDHCITVNQSSLYWLYKTDAGALAKNVHYSLEVERAEDVNITKYACPYKLIREEARLLPKVAALMIQDNDRAIALCRAIDGDTWPRTIHFPVSVSGDIIEEKSNYLHEQLNIPAHKKIILYFGAVYRDRLIEEMIEACEQMNSNDYVFVIHGAGDFGHLIHQHDKVKASNLMVHYHEITPIIASASVGFAIYDNGIDNNKLTAFSSEKISRYLQAGVPFIALRNDNYLRLQNEFKCCILIDDFSEVEAAVHTIEQNIEAYRQAAFAAYEKYFKIENSIRPLVALLTNSAKH